MISVGTFLAAVTMNAARIKEYRLGGDGSDGTCDCIGLPIGALRLSGVGYSNLHSSNHFPREEVKSLDYVSKASDLHPGQLVFKAYEPGESGWKLPARYAKDPDQRDYYHAGVVLKNAPLEIVHCSSGGIHYDSKMGKWRYASDLKQIDYENVEVVVPVTAVVYSENGGKVKIRQKPSTTCNIYETVSPGTILTVLDEGDEWSKVQIGGRQGYIMTKYLVADETPGGMDEAAEVRAGTTVTLSRSDAEAWYQALGRALGYV